MIAYSKIIAAAVVFVIIGMPLISYLYLREGLSFRIEAISALKQDEYENKLTEEFNGVFAISPKKVNAFVSADTISKVYRDEIFNKFKGNKYFQLCTYKSSESKTSNNLLAENHVEINLSKGQKELVENIDMLLIDTSGEIRETYQYSEEEFKSFIQHLSVLLPVESSKKIKLER